MDMLRLSVGGFCCCDQPLGFLYDSENTVPTSSASPVGAFAWTLLKVCDYVPLLSAITNIF